ncbi:D-xylose-proton symporter [termite gut metagenome]|uniref:D-xylose-proton symporter n=1 Tax=termite gut metagenome TaxID=433724 RepID=A0A5J4RIP6_9ZZZZ
MGGLLFGYDWVVVGGAKPFYEEFFNIADSPSIQGFVMGSAILGCLLGVMVSGALSDRYGRKPLMITASLIFIMAAAGTGIANTISWFIIYRIAGGIGIGIASNLSPMYIAEVSPPDVRGKFVSLTQLAIVIGILSAQLVNWLIAEPITPGENILQSWNCQTGWRWMFWAGGIPAAFFFIFVFIIPESPKWLGSQLNFTKAEKILTNIGGEEYAALEVEAMKISMTNIDKKSDYKLLVRGKMPKILMIGIVLAIFQQWCGINVIFNYAQEVFASAGYDVSDILFNIVITGITNVIFTIIGMYTVDKLGRRSLLLFGAIGLACIYSLLGACYYFHISGVLVLFLIMSAIGCYAMTLAPVVWVVISEIFPTKIRGMAIGISTFFLWTACFILTYTFPILNKELGSYGTFWLYGAICLLGFVYIKRTLPETKGKSLEEIETEFTK